METCVMQDAGSSQVASSLCCAAESLPAVSACIIILSQPPSIGSDKLNSASLTLWPGGGNDLIIYWQILGTIRHIPPLPISLLNSYSSPHPSITGHLTLCSEALRK